MRIVLAGMMVTAMVLGAGCSRNAGQGQPGSSEGADQTSTEAVTPDEVRQESAEAVGAAVALADQTKDEYVKRVQSELATVEQRMKTLRTKAAELGAQSRASANARIEQLSGKKEAMQERLSTVADATGDAWRELAQGMSQARQDMADALQRAEETFQAQSADEPDAPSTGTGG